LHRPHGVGCPPQSSPSSDEHASKTGKRQIAGARQPADDGAHVGALEYVELGLARPGRRAAIPVPPGPPGPPATLPGAVSSSSRAGDDAPKEAHAPKAPGSSLWFSKHLPTTPAGTSGALRKMQHISALTTPQSDKAEAAASNQTLVPALVLPSHGEPLAARLARRPSAPSSPSPFPPSTLACLRRARAWQRSLHHRPRILAPAPAEGTQYPSAPLPRLSYTMC